MAYHDELLTLAEHLVFTRPETQATLRRAVSTCYYAVFHLLIAEASSNWNNVPLRSWVARAFDHGQMKAASNRVANANESPYLGEDAQVVAILREIADTFSTLQQERQFADYNLVRDLKASDARLHLDSAQTVFRNWPLIRSHQIAQEYLVSLFVKRWPAS